MFGIFVRIRQQYERYNECIVDEQYLPAASRANVQELHYIFIFLEKRGNERQVKTLTLFNSFQYRQAAAYLNISNISNMHRRLFTFYAIVLYIFSLIVYL